MWLNLLKSRLGIKILDLNINRAAYIRRQVFAWYMHKRLGGLSIYQFLQLFKYLTIVDWLWLLTSIFDRASWNRLMRLFKVRGSSSAQVQWDSLKPLPSIQNIAQFSEWISGEKNI
jgi:glycosyltransferase involved in cell wall biosynthesis